LLRGRDAPSVGAAICCGDRVRKPIADEADKRSTSTLRCFTLSSVPGDEILTLFIEDCELLEQALASPDQLRLKSVVVVCRRLLLDESGVLHQVRRHLGVRDKLVFEVASDLLALDFATILGLKAAPAMQLAMIPDGLSPDSAPPGTRRIALPLDQFLARRVASVNGVAISVRDVIDFLANKDGAVHYKMKLEPDDQKLRDVNRALQVMNVDVLMSCMRGIVRVLLATASPLRREIMKR
jgi:hypothetical protein